MRTLGSTIKFQYNKSFYQDKRVLVFGGLGFMGQNLVRELVALGSYVRVVDLTGPVNRTLGGYLTSCTVYYADHCEKKLIDRTVASSEIIFNLAGRSGVVDSFEYPKESLKNCYQHLNILQMCSKHNPDAVIVFPSSCLVYEKSWIPVRESATVRPLSPYGVHKYTCEMYSRLYREVYGLPTVVLRISNPIGPYQYRVDGSYGVYNQFIYMAVKDRDITVYGEGTHLRDIISIDDVVQAFLCCAASHSVVDMVNVGRGVGISLCDYAQLVVDTVGSGQVVHVDWPKNSNGLASTDFVVDNRHICNLTNWSPGVDLSTIIAATAKFYRWAEVNSLIVDGEGK